MGEQMKLPQIKAIELFKKRMQLIALFWKDKKYDKNALDAKKDTAK